MMTEKIFLTELTRLTESPAWPLLLDWYKQRLAVRILEASNVDERERVWQSLRAASDFLTAVQNEVTTNRGNLDARKTRHERRPAAGSNGADTRQVRRKAVD